MKTRWYKCRCGQRWECNDTYRFMPAGSLPEIYCPECEKPGQLVSEREDYPEVPS